MAVEIKESAQEQPTSESLAERSGGYRGLPGDAEAPSYLRIVIDLPPEAAREFKQLIQETGDTLPNLIRKALGLYKLSKEAVQEGKFVGITGTEDALETEFVGF